MAHHSTRQVSSGSSSIVMQRWWSLGNRMQAPSVVNGVVVVHAAVVQPVLLLWWLQLQRVMQECQSVMRGSWLLSVEAPAVGAFAAANCRSCS